MLPANAERIRERLAERDLVLDVGGWADPFSRADWVLDLMPYETRGLYVHRGAGADRGPERFSAETWVQRDICDREPWPFADDQFDFAICSHTLEDVRDPVFVCSELVRVARAGYIEVPSRAEEQSRGVHGPWVGWTHHRWICVVGENGIEFVAKPHLIHFRPELSFADGHAETLEDEERVAWLFWHDRFEFGERIFSDGSELEAFLEAPVRSRRSWSAASRSSRTSAEAGASPRTAGWRRLRSLLSRLRR